MAKKNMWIGITIVAMAITVLLLIGYDVISFEKKPETGAKYRDSIEYVPDYRVVTIKGTEYKIDINIPRSSYGTKDALVTSYSALDEDNIRIRNTIVKCVKNDYGTHWEVEITPEEEPTTLSKFDPTNLPKAE